MQTGIVRSNRSLNFQPSYDFYFLINLSHEKDLKKILFYASHDAAK